MERLLLEIGCEEIPAGYIDPALKALLLELTNQMRELRIDYGPGLTCGTPRRLAVILDGVALKQRTVTTELLGPPQAVAYDAAGQPTLAATRFAEKAGVPLAEVTVKDTPKGAYLCAVKTEAGRATQECLAEILPAVILATPFPKTMRWGDLKITFARPIHWIVALLGETQISFTVGNISSGRHTFGHRFMTPERLVVRHAREYLAVLREGHVVADIEARRQQIMIEIEAAAQKQQGRILADEDLLDTVCHLVEYPTAVVGQFDAEFLELPREVLITAMREHQKYFAVVDDQGQLKPCFVTVNNTLARRPQLVADGNTRVLRARLNDARFFYEADRAKPLEALLPALEGVLFQARLGTMRAKVSRVQKLSQWIARAVGCPPEQIADCGRAGELCKADLVTQMVGEFPGLQGIMGRIYAGLSGEPAAVATAIEEHYRPLRAGGALPETLPGAVVSIADKTDSICGCFYAGLIPTGASDPYALRRQAIGILQIMQAFDLRFDLRDLLNASLQAFVSREASTFETTLTTVYEFIQNRLTHLLLEENYSRSVVTAVIASGMHPLPTVRPRLKALEQLRDADDYEPLTVAFKRVVNIIRKAEGSATLPIRPELFEHASEGALHQAVTDATNVVEQDLARADFDAALHTMAQLRPTVDAFFDGVMVMCEDPNRRANRLALLQQAARLFDRIADFSKLA